MDEISTSNINIKWLDNIYNQIINIRNFERNSKEGCSSLIDYVQIPFHLHNVILPDVMYKNFRLMFNEIDILISNLSPILNEKVNEYKKLLEPIRQKINDKNFFLKEIKDNNKIIFIQVLEPLIICTNHLSSVLSSIIVDIAPILYIKGDDGDNRKKW